MLPHIFEQNDDPESTGAAQTNSYASIEAVMWQTAA